MYCRKKHRGRWRHRVAENRRTAKPRGQSVATPTVREFLFVSRELGMIVFDAIGVVRNKCRSVRHRGKERLKRETLKPNQETRNERAGKESCKDIVADDSASR